ncbi:cytochrome c oxidase polypeptide I [Cutibacterium acnes JCM 18918]|nr:cytochrome c oxidase polypeptide I [Cutibacterium acnes JCM 18918]
MFVTGAVSLPFFSFMTFTIAVPTGVKFFNWIGTMWGGSLSFDTPMLFAIGFLTTFLFGGLTGVMLASPPMDFNVSDTYFVVAHFHYVLFGTVVFAMFAGFYYWWPKITGTCLTRPGARSTSGLCSSVSTPPSSFSTGLVLRVCSVVLPTTVHGRDSPYSTRCRPSAPSCWPFRCCRSHGTSGLLVTIRISRSLTRGVGAVPSSGLLHARRPPTISRR